MIAKVVAGIAVLVTGAALALVAACYFQIFDPRVELDTIAADHQKVVSSLVNRCFAEVRDNRTWSDDTWEALGLAPPLRKPDETRPTGTIVLQNPIQRVAILLSGRLVEDRTFYERDQKDSRSWSVRFHWIVAVLAATTTILIGIKALFANDGLADKCLTGASIFISATVTLFTTISAFYGEDDRALRDQRTIAQLAQLHWRIIHDIGIVDNACDPYDVKIPANPADGTKQAGKPPDYTSAMQNIAIAWKERYEAILSGAQTGLAAPGDLAAGHKVDTAPPPPPPPPPPG